MFDWNSIGGGARRTDSLMDELVDQVLAGTGAVQVDLVGHSAGGGVARSYLKDSLRASKVAHYVHIGSRKWEGQYAWFPNNKCLNIFSSGDRVAGAAAGPVTGTINLSLTDQDHYQVATCTESLDAMLQHFGNKSTPASIKTEKTTVELSGGAVTLDDNLPMAGARIKVYSFRNKDGRRRHADPDLSTTEDAHLI